MLKRTLSLVVLLAVVVSYQNCAAPFEVSKSSSSLSSVVPAPTPLPAGKVGVFMAAGHMGRTVLSCDGGQTWIRDQSANDAARCWVTNDPNYVECDHTEFSGRGLDYANGKFYINNGWGYNGTLRSTTDNVNFIVVKSGGWGSGIASIGNDLFLWWNNGQTSNNGGVTWVDNTTANFSAGLDHPNLYHIGDSLFAWDANPGGIRVSVDHGVSWSTPTGLAAFVVKDISVRGSTMLAIGQTADVTPIPYSARSSDGGRTWVTNALALNGWAGGWSNGWSKIIHDGTKYMSWSNGYVFKSMDGVIWSSEPMVYTAGNTGSIAAMIEFNPRTHTFTAFNGGWGIWYSNQVAFRSVDGVTWTQLGPTQWKGGHPLQRVIYAEVDRAVCP